MYFVNNRFATCPISFSLYSTFNARPELERTESGLLVYGRFCHTWLCFQKILQGVRLVKAHSGLPHMHPDSPGNFVFDFKVHFFSTPLIRFALFQKTGLRQKGRRRLRLRPPLP